MSCLSNRPSAIEEEEDLLKLQEQFLSSKDKPSVSVFKGSSSRPTKERKNVSATKGVTLKDSINITQKPPVPNIKEKCLDDSSISSCLFLHSKQGFPLVPILSDNELKQCSKLSSSSGKSLFAQRLKSHGLSQFRMVQREVSMPKFANVTPPDKDRIDPLEIGSVTLTNADTGQDGLTDYDGKCSSIAWDKFLKSSLVSGEGLLTAANGGGVRAETVQKELDAIHRENVVQLSKMSEKEIVLEQDKLSKQLGPGLVQFLQSRKVTTARGSGSGGSDPGRSRNGPGGSGSPTLEEHPKEPSSSGEDKKWLHMDKLEEEKLEWMKDLAMNSSNQQVYQEVRFSMDGMVISRSKGAKIPSHLGLHHHGDEPEAAGYTLKELIHLCCSKVSQQKAISLKAIAIIIRRARHNEYCGIIEGSTLEVLLESHVPKILRYALDDSTQTVQTEAVHALHSLLVSLPEEGFLDIYSSCFQGLYLPRLSSYVGSSSSKGSDGFDGDNDVMKENVIEGLLAMTLLPRLRYILEVCQPPVEMVTMILEMLITIARHSPNTANKVLLCPRLCTVVREIFLSSENPHPKAMKLFRALCASGRHTSQTMLSKYNILEPILRYCVLHPSAHSLPVSDSHQLYIEAAKTWAVLLSYGLTTDTFSDIFPTFLQLLSPPLSVTTMKSDNLLQSSAILNLLTIAEHVSAVTKTIIGTRPPLSLSWAHAEGMFGPAINCLTAILKDIEYLKEVKDYSLDRVQCVSAVQHLIASYFEELSFKPELQRQPIDLLQQVESLSLTVIEKFQQSKLYEVSLDTLSSCLDALPTAPPTPSSLPTLVSIPSLSPAVFGHTPLVNQSSDVGIVHVAISVFSDLLRSHLRLAQSLVGIHKGIADKVIRSVINAKFSNLLKSFNKLKIRNVFCLLMPLYLSLCSSLDILAKYGGEKLSPSLASLIYETAFKLLGFLPPGLEVCVINLLSRIIFNPALYHHRTDNSSPCIDKGILLLVPVSQSYLDCIHQTTTINGDTIHHSDYWLRSNPVEVDSLLLPCCKESLLPSDWPYIPLVLAYKISQSSESEEVSTTIINHTLYFLLLLECIHGSAISNISPAIRVAKIFYVFLSGSDFFYDKTIRSLLCELLSCYASMEVDFFNTPIPGVPSFPDLYISLLEQFSSVSYGDHLFAQYVLLPIQQTSSVVLRKVLWMDHAHITRIITLSPSNISIPINSFLYPLESDWDLIQQYFRLLVSKSITQERNPLLYIIALHHIHHFFVNNEASEVHRKSLLSLVLNLPKLELVKNILLFLEVNEDGAVQFETSISSSLTKFIVEDCGHCLPSL